MKEVRPYVSAAARHGCPRADLCFGMTCVVPGICYDPTVNYDRKEWKRRLDALITEEEVDEA